MSSPAEFKTTVDTDGKPKLNQAKKDLLRNLIVGVEVKLDGQVQIKRFEKMPKFFRSRSSAYSASERSWLVLGLCSRKWIEANYETLEEAEKMDAITYAAETIFNFVHSDKDGQITRPFGRDIHYLTCVLPKVLQDSRIRKGLALYLKWKEEQAKKDMATKRPAPKPCSTPSPKRRRVSYYDTPFDYEATLRAQRASMPAWNGAIYRALPWLK